MSLANVLGGDVESTVPSPRLWRTGFAENERDGASSIRKDDRADFLEPMGTYRTGKYDSQVKGW
jgi:hypothetical protein